jgi:uncharacterized protein YndB with AHSA1/START domain
MAEDKQKEPEARGSHNGSEEGSNARSSLTGILLPAAATAAAAAAAGFAAKKAPDLLKRITGEAGEEAEELGRKSAVGAREELGARGGIAGKAISGITGRRGGGGHSGGKTRRLPIQRWTDVAVPVEKVYDAWTQFEEFPKFMHRVLEVKEEDENKIHWREKIWFSTREWDGEITDRRKNDRIAWKSVSGPQHSGVISFHRLDRNLTRVLVTLDFVPTGIVEKMASGLRFVKRAVEADLARFKAYAELGDAKGLEYRSKPAEMEQHRGADEEEQPRERGEAESHAGEQAEQRRGANGRDLESERRERENRRKERRDALASSR